MLVFDDLSLRVAGRLLIEGASAQLPAGSRVGLVGRNGTGKTSLFRAIVGELGLEGGSINMPRSARIGRLAQEAPSGPDRLIDLVLAADTERTALLVEAETAHEPHRIADIHMRLADIDAHAAPARAAAILSGLGFSAAEQERPVDSFSGGWRMRVALAALLFSAPDLLLLDEPTNYLDLEGTLWLQDFLARYPQSVLIISHDRDLLDTSVNGILHLERSKLTFYRGNYSSFARQHAERQTLDAKKAKTQAAERKRIEAFVARFRAKATKARQAQSRLKLLAKLEPIEAITDNSVRPIAFPAPEKTLSPPILAIDEVTVGYEQPVLRDLTLRIDDDDRIALLGSNGNGKSTLAKLLAGRLAPMSGSITRAEKLTVAYFAQHQLDELVEGDSAYEHVRRRMPDAPEAKVRARVATIGFSGGMADTKVGSLSGGEKARLLLGLATLHGPHLVILDEPTNHLDIDSRAALIEALNEYPGAVILISHDRYLIEACADRLWEVANGTVTPLDDDIDAYRRRILSTRRGDNGKASAKREAEPRGSKTDARRAAADKRVELTPLRTRVKTAEDAIKRLTRELASLDAQLGDPNLHRDAGKLAQLGKARATTAAGLARAEADWLAASSEYEAARSEGT